MEPQQPPHLFLVGLWGAGNLGDDLLGACLVQKLRDRIPNVQLSILDRGARTDLTDGVLAKGVRPIASTTRSTDVRAHIERCDAVLFGGGGLLQDTHHPFRPHQWFRWVHAALDIGVPVAAVGLGVGPIRQRYNWNEIGRNLRRFRLVQVRDEYSRALLAGLGVDAEVSSDIAAGSSLEGFGVHRTTIRDGYLGCSLRVWPGLSADASARVLKERVVANGFAGVRLFAFEHRRSYTGEADFLAEIANLLRRSGVRAEVVAYGSVSMEEFAEAMARVDLALAMRFHANVIWHHLGVPTVPIVYAPKVHSLVDASMATTVVTKMANPVEALAGEPLPQAPLFSAYDLPPIEQLVGERRGPDDARSAVRAHRLVMDVGDLAYRLYRRTTRRLR